MFSRWLYTSFIAVDANFRLKLKRRGINDLEFGSGSSYFVENKGYIQHVSKYKTVETEVSPVRYPTAHVAHTTRQAVGCGSDFHAVSKANTNSSKDYISTGVVACVCARYSLVQKNGVGDLQLGER